MKIRFENNEVLVDFNSRGWNPTVLLSDMTDQKISDFKEALDDYCGSNYVETEDLDFQDCVKIVVGLASTGRL